MRTPDFRPRSAGAPAGCPACGSPRLFPFFEIERVPSTTTLLIPTREEAREQPVGDIRLFLCEDCGFVHNPLFDASLTEYSERYEGTQSFSPTFDGYHQELARDLIERYGLRGRRVLEVGCGQGEFLHLLCRLGDMEGIGFDPAVRSEGVPGEPGLRLRFVKDFYSEAWAEVDADLYCCKMTMEHIPDVGAFTAMLRRAIGDRPDAIVFVQVPEVGLILREAQFYDVMHEHCSYFTPASLRRLFADHGFDVLDARVTYEGQHISLEARPGRPGAPVPPPSAPDPAFVETCRTFADRCAGRAAAWAERIGRAVEAGRRVVLWGSGSKATSFLTALGIRDEIEQVVDINPNRQGMFLATCGQEIVAPGQLVERPPDLVIAVNPIYREEIRRQLSDLGLEPELLTLAP